MVGRFPDLPGESVAYCRQMAKSHLEHGSPGQPLGGGVDVPPRPAFSPVSAITEQTTRCSRADTIPTSCGFRVRAVQYDLYLVVSGDGRDEK
jgi:hypothetical protein